MSYSNLLATLLLATFIMQVAYASVRSVFIFGDSTADVGTNNYLPESLARADYPHYGIDFPNLRPTGRFSNGLNTADFVAKFMGFKRSPQPYLFLLNQSKSLRKPTFRGANFASGGSGLLDGTGKTFRKVVSLSEQIRQFITVKENLIAARGLENTQNELAESVFTISTGTNDIFYYFASNRTIPPEQFIATLKDYYEAAIQDLYSNGARKFGIISIPPIGCCPVNRLLNTTEGCFEPMNDLAQDFYLALNSILGKLASELPYMKYSLGNTYAMIISLMKHPSSLYFVNVDTACCGDGRLNAEIHCNSTTSVCLNRHQYLFWDLYHPTQAASKIAAETLYDGGLEFVSPINFRHLAENG